MSQSQSYLLFSVLLIYSMKITFNGTVRLLPSLASQGRSPKRKTCNSLGVQAYFKAFNFFYLPKYCNPIVTFIFNKINYIFVLTLLTLVISVTFKLAAIYCPA